MHKITTLADLVNATGVTYFASDGSFGSARGMVVIDTSKFTVEHWDSIEECSDHIRSLLALEIAASIEKAHSKND